MDFYSYIYTNTGDRLYNEDSANYFINGNNGIWVLADGLGGHGHGELASNAVVNYFIDNFKSIDENTVNYFEWLKGTCESSNTFIMQPVFKKSLTTLVSASVYKNILYTAHAGDSRFYYFKNDSIIFQTKDHSVSQKSVDLGEITTEQIRFHIDRNKLLCAVGNENFHPTIIKHNIKIQKGDAFLLCSDGFWEYVYETEMEIDLLKSTTVNEWAEFMLSRLINRFNNNNDNFTLLCCMIK